MSPCAPEVVLVDVSVWTWLVTVAVLLVLLAVDLFVVDHDPHAVSVREAGAWTAAYVLLAVAFGVGVVLVSGPTYGGQFFAGWLTEYSLSVDNLFVFLVIMSSFAVPVVHQHRVLLVGILIALVLRGAFIAVGAAAISRFSWVFYVFGGFLLLTAVRVAREGPGGEPGDGAGDNALVRAVRRVLPLSEDYDGPRVLTRVDGRRVFTPLLVVMIAIGTTDVLFALDSIPAVFGLTKEPYLVFTANAFALMGLRQLYFLLGGLLQRLAYLSYGLAVVLGFIGVKLVLEALHEEGVGWAPQLPIAVSLVVILGVLAVTTVASLLATGGRAADRADTGDTVGR